MQQQSLLDKTVSLILTIALGAWFLTLKYETGPRQTFTVETSEMADSLPQLDIDSRCRALLPSEYTGCIKAEQNAYRWLKSRWPHVKYPSCPVSNFTSYTAIAEACDDAKFPVH